MMRRRFLGLTALLVIIAAGYAYWSRAAEQSDQPFLTETLDRGDITAIVTATGTVNPVITVQVGTYVSGPIRAIDVDFNSPVRKGQRVAQIDPAPFQVKVLAAEANVANARARVGKARADMGLKKLMLERSQELRRRKLIAQEELDTALSNYEQAAAQLQLEEASVKQAEAELAEAQINLGYTDIVSPVDGTVVSRNVDVGQTVAASFQTPTLFLIAEDLTKMQVNANVSESDIGTVGEGQSAVFTVDAYPERHFVGKVVQVRNAPINVQNVITYDVIIGVDNPELALKPGMTATVNITTDRRGDVLRLPLRALRFNPEGTAVNAGGGSTARRIGEPEPRPAVWTLGDRDTLQRVELETGLRDERNVEVLSGNLHAGDRVVVAQRRTEEQRPASYQPGFIPRRR